MRALRPLCSLAAVAVATVVLFSSTAASA